MNERDTIFALASGRGAAAIAVIRLSGPACAAALRALGATALPPARMATRVRLRHPERGGVLDDALVLWFPGPGSYTGEDAAELSVHGGRAVVEAVAAALASLPGLRPAEPGEFTRRAFENGKLDLTQVEAVADLVAAETDAQRIQALGQLGGALGARFEGWRAQLTGALAEVEAAVDFSDEEIPDGLLVDVGPKISGILGSMAQYIEDDGRGERLRDGLRVAILGAPNVGKSSLLNAIARRDVAIVSEVAGTTRDVIEVHLDLGGLPVIVSDTAGLRDGADPIEAEGMRRAAVWAEEADLRLVVVDARELPAIDEAVLPYVGPGAVVVANKVDLLDTKGPVADLAPGNGKPATETVGVSARTGVGLPSLLRRIEALLADSLGSAGMAPLTRARHRVALRDAMTALERAQSFVEDGMAAESPELLAEELRAGVAAVGRVAGRVDVEDVLDRVFADFCIGK